MGAIRQHTGAREAVAARWTPHAVGIEFKVAGTMQRCWVWEGAVEGLSEESGG